jgi:hypothetical protein
MNWRDKDTKGNAVENNTVMPIKIVEDIVRTENGECILKLSKIFRIETRKTNSGET